MTYRITYNYIDRIGTCDVLYGSADATRGGDGIRFRLYDDDDECYFEGLYYGNPNSQAAFAPLDGIGSSYGCTYIEYRIGDVGGCPRWAQL